MQPNKIPNLQIQTIGAGKNTLRVIKGFIELPCWTDYYLCEQPNYVFKTKVVTSGRIDLWVDSEITAGDNFTIDQEQINAYYYLLEQQEKIKAAILQELKKEFPRLLEDDYASWDEDDVYLPKLADLTPEFDFKNYIGPSSITIEKDVKDDMAYINWHFECIWDIEHGFDVITHKDRVIDVSPHADILKINKDNGTYEAMEKELQHKEWIMPKKKKWWQFW